MEVIGQTGHFCLFLAGTQIITFGSECLYPLRQQAIFFMGARVTVDGIFI